MKPEIVPVEPLKKISARRFGEIRKTSSERLGIGMYDLRILIIWSILGFLLYLIVQKPDLIRSGEDISGGAEKNSDELFPDSNPWGSESMLIASLLKEINFPPRVRLKELVISEGAYGILPGEMIRAYGVIPLKVEDGRIYLAMVNPFDFEAVDEIREITGREIEPVEIARKDFNEMLKCIGEIAY